MTNTHGNKVLVDSDALIGFVHKDDILHKRCIEILEHILESNYSIVVPYPITLEASTTLARRMNRSDLAAQLLSDFSSMKEKLSHDDDIEQLVAKLYKPQTSKKTTPFDHYVLSLAKKNNIRLIFSFDSFYRKNGLILIEEFIKKSI